MSEELNQQSGNQLSNQLSNQFNENISVKKEDTTEYTTEYTKEDTKEETKVDKTNKMIYIYQNLFVSSVVTIVNLLKTVSEKNKDKIPSEKQPSFDKMLKTCDDILKQYKNTEEKTDTNDKNDKNDKNNDVDQVRVIKKAFKVLKDNHILIKTHDCTLFTVRTPEGKIMTIIPGLNINLVLPLLDEAEQTELWDSIESMFVTSVKMVYMMTDPSRHNKEVSQIVSELEQKSLKKLNNFFMGLNLNNSEENLSMEQLMSNDIVIPGTEANSGLLGKIGVDKLMDVGNLTNEIKKFDDNDINETINTLTSLLGNDNDIKDVCSTMVKSVLEDIKTNGIENMFSIAERVSGKLNDKIDPSKMAKTAHGMNDLIKNNSDKFNDLKDEKGNPIGADFLKQFQSTLNMANMFKKK